MNNKLTPRQMINLELATRAKNQQAAETLKQHIPEEEQSETKILFNCECATPECVERVPLTLKEYDQLHSHEGRFVIINGHSEPKVETIKAGNKHINVVDKYALS